MNSVSLRWVGHTIIGGTVTSSSAGRHGEILSRLFCFLRPHGRDLVNNVVKKVTLCIVATELSDEKVYVVLKTRSDADPAY